MDTPEPLSRDAARVTHASLGVHSRRLLRLSDLPTTGAGLTGPGAIAAARGLLASALSAGGPWTPAAEASLIITADDLERILPGHTELTSSLERLRVTHTLEAALDELDRQLLSRARLAADTADLATTIGAESEHSLAPVVVLATAPTGALATRLAAVLTVGARLAITGVVLGDWPTGQTWQVNPDGTTTIDGHDGPRLNTLDATATREILDTVRQARPASDDLPTALPSTQRPGTAPTALPATGKSASSDDAHASSTGLLPTSSDQRLRLTVLGRPAVHLNTADAIRIRRSDGVQILIHLAVNPAGATSDELMALLWPEIRPQYSRRRFHTTMSELRQTLTEAAGADPIPRTDERYHLDPHLVAVDLWALNAQLDRAATAVDPTQHAAALRTAIAAYTGTIAEGHNWLWLAPYREALRRHLIDAHVALADDAPQASEALTLIQAAIRLDPYNEDLYQRAMRHHAQLSSPDGVRRTLRTLTERLAELEIRVSPQSEQVATELLERLGLRERVQHSPD